MSFKNWLNENFTRSTTSSEFITLIKELQEEVGREFASQEFDRNAETLIKRLEAAAKDSVKSDYRRLLHDIEQLTRMAKNIYESYGLSERINTLADNLKTKLNHTMSIVTNLGKGSRDDLAPGKGGLSQMDKRDFDSQEYDRKTKVHPEKANIGFTHKQLTRGINSFVPTEPTDRFKRYGEFKARDQKDLIVLFKDLERAISRTPHGPKLMAAIEQDYTDMATWSVALDAMEEETGRDTSKFRARLQRAIENLK